MRFYLLISMYLLALLGVYFFTLGIVWYILLTGVLLSFIVWGVASVQLNLFVTSICSIKDGNNEIALTFDDGPDRELTPQILDILNEYGAKATFFCIGSKLKGNEDIIQRMLNEGHAIGNHSYEHSFNFPMWSAKRIKQSIQKTDAIISELSGVDCTIFRPPFGITNNLIAIALKQLGKKSIGWSIRTKDTCNTPDKVVAKVRKNLAPGSIVLLHDTNKSIVSELIEILDYCQSKNLKSIALL